MTSARIPVRSARIQPRRFFAGLDEKKGLLYTKLYMCLCCIPLWISYTASLFFHRGLQKTAWLNTCRPHWNACRRHGNKHRQPERGKLSAGHQNISRIHYFSESLENAKDLIGLGGNREAKAKFALLILQGPESPRRESRSEIKCLMI